ncbi:MAG TPA: ribosome biogenesis/translation initiation ATPase RLI [Methanoculleus sp.]|jgi:ATP-binding cassette subfamily E protein 1|uniref:ribosome biogenesis/translation initiation ATPase RLI n=1 Tax=Methanoculleus sp. TaxID=90427 RepID=UPI001B3FAB7C|nr:ribosome biogenesis/translation initiation ATPase RLI [Methanoculleus sp.]MBP7144965.1 ribosome biogenesis/translation initiation ATPase RLI [Methanoculleus sp.]HNQ32655.1 ribosome biogenesis/translation initiation ATPase RLI [Methanoculleus sp.]HNT07466.1 ribosome biogenesis/translation initiation ATPase RLI [Methanoculleus sp.]HNV38462.1 ribosome biogenesis/translation initiation ATPase RLI [Methanoculleus sp.]HOC84301.1 ribosome biogenesis/translation initiation ATPase RLI [Methanoculleu
MRIAVVHRDRCHPVKCGTECILYCPRVRTGDETVVIGEDQKAVISEELCVGCGICVKKCPFEALAIVNLPEELDQPTHRYGKNGFVLYGLPIPIEGKVTGILGPNGIGKSTSVKILSGTLVPNLGRTDAPVSWKEVLDLYQGTELFDYLQVLSQKNVKVAVKPQYIDQIPKVFTGSVRDLLATTDERGKLGYYIDRLSLKAVVDRPITNLSGGELQRVAIAACLARDADFYFFDEITPYLDVYQRMAAADLIRELARERPVVIVEHDLAILDMLADTVHIAYGEPAVFGVITYPKGVRVGINQYLEGFLPEENVRFRPYAVTFDARAHAAGTDREVLLTFPAMTKQFTQFSLSVGGGEIRSGEVLGVLGANGIGKSTFAGLLAGVIEPDTGSMDTRVRISYKPQYLKGDTDATVEEVLRQTTTKFDTSFYQHEILEPLSLSPLLQAPVNTLSGGELQRVAIAVCLSRDADLYILDEPSAHLDVEQRVKISRMIRKHAEGRGASTLVIDHDIYVIDMISDRILVFEGEPGIRGKAVGPFDMAPGMNRFLSALGVTFRRDRSGRPRINKPGSFLDREQVAAGEYYYTEISKS